MFFKRFVVDLFYFNNQSFFICMCSQHLLAQWMCRKGDYRSAMTHEKEALTAFTSLVSDCNKKEKKNCWHRDQLLLSSFINAFFYFPKFGEDHPQTSCSKEFLSTITKQAVKVERTLRQAGADCTEQTVEVRQELVLRSCRGWNPTHFALLSCLFSVLESNNRNGSGADGSGYRNPKNYTQVHKFDFFFLSFVFVIY